MIAKIAKFDVKVQAHSLSKLMAMAEACITKAGGGVHTERLIDYASGEFGRLTIKQCLEVLAEIDKDYEKKLLKDGYGEIIGYAHSKKIFVTFRRQQQSIDTDFAKFGLKSKGRKA
jgi:hypothetical protein